MGHRADAHQLCPACLRRLPPASVHETGHLVTIGWLCLTCGTLTWLLRCASRRQANSLLQALNPAVVNIERRHITTQSCRCGPK
jgi:hypothetical protein